MTTKTTKSDAQNLLDQLQVKFQGQTWFKKGVLDADDLGWCINIYINKPAMEAAGHAIPHQTKVKICVYNVN